MVVARRASERDVAPLSVLLAQAFLDDAMLTWTFPSDGVEERIRRNFEVLDRLAAARGWLWTAGDNAAVALWVPPGSAGEYEELMAELGPEVAGLTDDGGARFDSFWGWVEHHRPPSLTGISTTWRSRALAGVRDSVWRSSSTGSTWRTRTAQDLPRHVACIERRLLRAKGIRSHGRG